MHARYSAQHRDQDEAPIILVRQNLHRDILMAVGMQSIPGFG
jgi:hypothetical protein